MLPKVNRRSFVKTVALATAAQALPAVIQAAEKSVAPSEVYKKIPRCWRAPEARLNLEGNAGRYIANVTEQWLKVAPLSNPAMLDIFRERDRLPRRDLVPWAGEFAGKYLVSALQIYRWRRDEGLRAFLNRFVAQLI